MYPAEQAGLERTLENLDIEAGELDALDHRVHDLRSQLRQSVEILEEDHGKAIFVFTMVTTIFLPLYVPQVYVLTISNSSIQVFCQQLFWHEFCRHPGHGETTRCLLGDRSTSHGRDHRRGCVSCKSRRQGLGNDHPGAAAIEGARAAIVDVGGL